MAKNLLTRIYYNLKKKTIIIEINFNRLIENFISNYLDRLFKLVSLLKSNF